MTVVGPRLHTAEELERFEAELARPSWRERRSIHVADGIASAGARVYFVPAPGVVAFDGTVKVASSSAPEAAVLVVMPGGDEVKLPAWDLYLNPTCE